MANAVYAKAKQSLLNGEINTQAFNYKLLLVDKSIYNVNLSTDQYLVDIPSSSIKAVSANLSNVTNINGVLNANDVNFSHNGSAFDSLILYQVGTQDSNSRLVIYIDDSTGLPFEGSNSSISITIIWSETVSKILSL